MLLLPIAVAELTEERIGFDGQRKSIELFRNGPESRSVDGSEKHGGHRPKYVDTPDVCIRASRFHGYANRNRLAGHHDLGCVCRFPHVGRHDNLVHWLKMRPNQGRGQLRLLVFFS
jgi:hypothetical protein